MKRPSGPIVLLAAAGLLAPLFGGQLQMEASSLAPGSGPLIGAILGSPDAPALSHMLLALLVLMALGWAIASRHVLQAPNLRVSLPLTGFFALLVFSVAISSFKMTSLYSLAEWLCYGAAFIAVVASVGRVDGPRIIVMAVFTGCVLVALRGIWEYSRPGTPPDWRIFAGWQHPNALAGMLSTGLMLGLGLTLALDRLASFAAGAGSAAIGFALVLTQSKGGYLAAGTGIVALILLTLALWSDVRRVSRVGAVLAATAALVGALALRPQPGGVGSPLGRVSSMSGTSEQSAGVRTNLWKTSLVLIRGNLGGYGLNTFQFHSARPGIVMSGVQQAHNSFLQIAVEAGPFALLLFIGFALMLLYEMLRSSRKLPPENTLLRMGVLSALIATSAHSMFDSDLYHMGIGLTYFFLCGIGLLLSADGVLPELLPKSMRTTLVAITGLTLGLIGYSAAVGLMKSRVNGDITVGDLTGARDGADTLLGLAPMDGEAHYVRSRLAASTKEAMSHLRRAIALRPVPRYLRALAMLQAQSGQAQVALSTLEQVFEWDPNNLPALYMKMNLQREIGETGAARATATTLANSTSQTFFKVRALPEQVPLEPYRAHGFLARESSGQDKVRHLEEALEGFHAFAIHVEQNVALGTETLEQARDAIAEGQEVISQLQAIYRRDGDELALEKLKEKARLFSDRLEALNK